MESGIKWKYNDNARKDVKKIPTQLFSAKETDKVLNFHKSFGQYQPTPLRSLPGLAGHLGVSGVYVKDESYRFGLNAFKVLGGSFAIGMYLANRLGVDISELSFDMLKSKDIKEKLGEITFTSATDGNHGRGVGWAAQQLGHKSVIYMPKGSSAIRYNSIKSTGAETYITDFNYDDAVRLAADNAKKHGWVVIQDTAWEGYADIPTWIMQGYATMAVEALEQLRDSGIDRPTHIFIQAGVGSLAGAMQGYFASVFGDSRPISVIVEAHKANCLYKSALAGDGKPRKVDGDLDTIMAGLACGEPNPISWNLLWDYSDMFISCPDYVAARGMRILGNPLANDTRVVSGESGAVTSGLLSFILQAENMREVREVLNLNRDSKILLFNTEGDTDPENYRRIVWDGLYPYIWKGGAKLHVNIRREGTKSRPAMSGALKKA